MAGLRALFRRVAQAVEEEAARQRGDDPRVRSGYGAYHGREQPQQDAVWETERETAHTPPRAWRAKTTRSPWGREQSESPAPMSATRRAPETHRAQPTRSLALGHGRVTNDPALRACVPHPRAPGAHTRTPRHSGCTARSVRDQGDPGPATGAAARQVAWFRRTGATARPPGASEELRSLRDALGDGLAVAPAL